MNDRPQLTVEDLDRWVEGGATWRAVEVDDRFAVVQLCTCTGEPVDLLRGEGADLVDYVRSHGLRHEGPD